MIILDDKDIIISLPLQTTLNSIKYSSEHVAQVELSMQDSQLETHAKENHVYHEKHIPMSTIIYSPHARTHTHI